MRGYAYATLAVILFLAVIAFASQYIPLLVQLILKGLA